MDPVETWGTMSSHSFTVNMYMQLHELHEATFTCSFMSIILLTITKYDHSFVKFSTKTFHGNNSCKQVLQTDRLPCHQSSLICAFSFYRPLPSSRKGAASRLKRQHPETSNSPSVCIEYINKFQHTCEKSIQWP